MPAPHTSPHPTPLVKMSDSAPTASPDLRLMTVYDLWDAGTVDHHQAAEERAHAFHEAGHIFTAGRLGLTPHSASVSEDGSPFVGPDEETTILIAAAGFFAQGLVLEADHFRREQQIPADDPLNLIELEEFIEPHSVTEDIASMKQHCCCRRGGDEIALQRLADQEWVATNLLWFLTGWHYIDCLAYDLLTNVRLDEAAIRNAH